MTCHHKKLRPSTVEYASGPEINITNTLAQYWDLEEFRSVELVHGGSMGTGNIKASITQSISLSRVPSFSHSSYSAIQCSIQCSWPFS